MLQLTKGWTVNTAARHCCEVGQLDFREADLGAWLQKFSQQMQLAGLVPKMVRPVPSDTDHNTYLNSKVTSKPAMGLRPEGLEITFQIKKVKFSPQRREVAKKAKFCEFGVLKSAMKGSQRVQYLKQQTDNISIGTIFDTPRETKRDPICVQDRTKCTKSKSNDGLSRGERT